MEIKNMSILQRDISKYIAESIKRCKKRNLDPNVIPELETVSLLELGQKMYQFKSVLKVTDFFVEKFFQMIDDIPIQLAVTDEKGTILEIKGDADIKDKMKHMGFRPGIKFREEYAGTNSVSLALETNQPVQLIGAQHYHNFLKTTACYSVPFEFENLHLKGTFSVVTLADYQSPLLLTLLSTTVDLIERELIVREQNKQLNIFNQVVTESTQNGIIKVDHEGVIVKKTNCTIILIKSLKKDRSYLILK
jgi:transcriptional regulator of acetoin/glycerol metabolism